MLKLTLIITLDIIAWELFFNSVKELRKNKKGE